MLKALIFLYRPVFARTIVYMLQSVEYRPGPYLKWLERVKDFRKVAYRKDLVPTRPARLLLLAFRFGFWAETIISLLLLWRGLDEKSVSLSLYAVALLLASPLIWSVLIILPLWLGGWLVVRPSNFVKIRFASDILAAHPGIKIAVAGSYGKTTMKEILLTILSEGKKVAATPANRNVSISHAHFAAGLHGDEDILILEYGEGQPGDITRFAKRTHPDIGVITGLAPAHLDKYKTLQAAGKDIFSLAGYVKKLYVNTDSPPVEPFLKKAYVEFSSGGIDSWKVDNIKMDIKGLSFRLGGKDGLDVKSSLLGRHLIAPLALAVYLARQYGLTDKQIQAGIAKIESFEHRMKPYELSGAWIIDDTYNGNIEGMKAGLALLSDLDAKRKVYVTPGLVDQGADSDSIHVELGQAITKAAPDEVILMKHSVTDSIVEGMAKYKGQLTIEEDPLNFYTNLDKYVAAGDLVLLQNDWPDQYN
jgi:UDP-N-acetylmuramoyl-tripeptide--D-alanyl-D-alanine ligase